MASTGDGSRPVREYAWQVPGMYSNMAGGEDLLFQVAFRAGKEPQRIAHDLGLRAFFAFGDPGQQAKLGGAEADGGLLSGGHFGNGMGQSV